MIRTACAWMLVLLAASPVTAPFATFDLRRLAAETALVQPPFAQFGSISATESDGVDAYSLSPIVTRSALPPDSPASASMPPALAPVPAQASRLPAPRDLNRSPHEQPVSARVLRI